MADPDIHAVVSTGAKSVPLPGGRSRRTVNGVPILELHEDVVAKVARSVGALLDPEAETEYLTGAMAFMHTPRELGHGRPDVVVFRIGGSTLDEAAKECITAFEDSYSADPPTWVASTSDDLAEVLAEHYGCPVKGMDEELSA
jgi:hypothetical protein